jgi:hypothetical protein
MPDMAQSRSWAGAIPEQAEIRRPGYKRALSPRRTG